MDKKNYVILSLIVSIMFLSICYLNLSSVAGLNKSELGVGKLWNVKITNMKTYKINGSAIELSNPSFTNMTGTYNVFFKNVGDSITYEITIKNEGNIDAKLDSIISSPKNNNISVKFDNLLMGKTLLSKEEIKGYITISYDNKTDNDLIDNKTIILNYVQK